MRDFLLHLLFPNMDALRAELADVAGERDDLRRQLRDVRTAHEPLYRALYPNAWKRGVPAMNAPDG